MKAKPKKEKKLEAKVLNDPKELGIDATVIKSETKEEWDVKTLGAESDIKLEADKGVGQAITLRFFTYGANVDTFKKHLPTEQELFNLHWKQMEFEMWKDGWSAFTSVEPRLQWSVNGKDFEGFSPQGKQYTHYRFIVAATPAKGNIMSIREKPLTLSEIANARNTNI